MSCGNQLAPGLPNSFSESFTSTSFLSAYCAWRQPYRGDTHASGESEASQASGCRDRWFCELWVSIYISLLRRICGCPPDVLGAQPQSPGFSRHLSGVRWTLHQCPRIGTLEVPGETESGSAGTQPGKGYSGRWCADGASDPGSPMVSGVASFCVIGHLSHA